MSCKHTQFFFIPFPRCTQIAEVLEFVIDASKWFSTSKLGPFLQQICVRIFGSTRNFEYPTVTRFAGKLLQLKKFFAMKMALQQCVTSDKYERYNFEDDVFANEIEDGEIWDLLARICKSTGPLLLLVRLGDLMTATLSKLKGTVDYIKTLMVQTGDDSLEDKIATIFHDMVGNLESDVANCAYCIDPQFVHKSRDAPQDVMKSFWKVARQILAHACTDTEWLSIRAILATELQAFRMKSGGFALEDYSMLDTCIFWGVAGCHAPTLKKIVFALAPLPCSSSEAERNWFELKSNKTKTRNRLSREAIQKTIFVRRFLSLEDKLLTGDTHDSVYKQWVKVLLRDAARSIAGADDGGADVGDNDEEDMMSLAVFDDNVDADEQLKINGKNMSGKSVIRLTALRKNKAARSFLFEKYYNMCFVDKNPEDPSADAEPLEDPSKWEHRQIQNISWSRYLTHVVDTVIIDHDDDEPVEPYTIDECMMEMIRASPHNTRQIKSKVIDDPKPTESPPTADSDPDSDSSTAVQSSQVANV